MKIGLGVPEVSKQRLITVSKWHLGVGLAAAQLSWRAMNRTSWPLVQVLSSTITGDDGENQILIQWISNFRAAARHAYMLASNVCHDWRMYRLKPYEAELVRSRPTKGYRLMYTTQIKQHQQRLRKVSTSGHSSKYVNWFWLIDIFNPLSFRSTAWFQRFISATYWTSSNVWANWKSSWSISLASTILIVVCRRVQRMLENTYH